MSRYIEETGNVGSAPDSAVVADLAAQALGVVAEEGNARVVIVPAGADAKVIDLNQYAATPTRPTGTARPKSVEAFIDYVKRHSTPETTVWYEPMGSDAGRIVAVLNDLGEAQDAQWRDVRAELILPKTPQWEHWAARDGVYGSQQEFAEHIEDGVDEIREPDAATMLEIAQTFQATIGGEFRQATRLQDGTINVQWAEHVDARAGKNGEAVIPQTMVLGISPFYGEQPFAVEARIRYRVRNGALSIGYKLDRPDRVIQECVEAIGKRLRDELDAPVYAGAPAAAPSSRDY